MKKAFLLLCGVIILCSAHAQTNNTIVKFNKFYTANQPDSIYHLYTKQMKGALSIEGNRQLITQINTLLGEIADMREMDTKGAGIAEFRLSFEKPLVEISLMVKEDSIAGILQKAAPTKAVTGTDNESPDNFYIDNSIGKIYGTLTLPKDKKKVPLVLMIAGSGPTDRNMNQGEGLRTNSFLLLAKGLAENGIASLRYDKRGVGASMAAVNTPNLTLDDFINDANLLVSKLAVDERFSDIIILGHSEGAAIGLMTSIVTAPAAFISFSGYQNDMVTLIGEQLKPALSPKDYALFTELADSLKAGKIVNRNFPASLAPMFTQSSQVFLRSTIKYDQSKEIQKLNIPILVIGGSTDLQVPAKAAAQLAKMNKGATLKVIPAMNHVLKRAPAEKMANLATYDQPTLPLHEDILPLITNFIKKHSTL
ncbi:alpha/beta hydrolase family protein [Pedobacter sp.]|uniref:alpha/beta hydrolase family protein n=1 Tax=Pedobacter sp. TaxID=1411316 RepID=UPI003D7F68A2